MPDAVIDPVNPELVPLRAAARPADRTPEEASDGAADLSPAKLLHALRRRWLIAVPLATLAAAAAGYAGSHFVRPVSTVRAMVHLSAERPAAVYENSTEGRPDFAHLQRSQVLVLKSRAVLQAAVRNLEPAGLAVLAQPDPVGWLEQDLQTDYVVAPDILRLSLKGTDPDELTAVLDAVRTAFIREIERRDREGRDGRARQLADVRDQHEARAADLRRQLLAKAEGLGSQDAVTLRAKHDYALGVVHALRTEVVFHKSAVRRAELENGDRKSVV